MKRFVRTVGMIASLTALNTGVAQAQQTEGNWMVRVRALQLDPADKSDAGTGPLAGLPADAITVSDKVIPEIDISYFFTKNIAAELVLTVPQKHDVYVNGSNIGTFKHLPPTLLIQYHFMPDSQFRPYVGAGINYTRISDVNLLNGAGDLENNSWGLAVQAGFDVKVAEQAFLNFDVKKVQIQSDVMVSGQRASTVHVDPLLWGVGIGYRF
jgi:outer membrane protein